MPHIDRCPDCNAPIEFDRAWSDQGDDFEDWKCPLCGKTRTMLRQDWPVWFYRTQQEEAIARKTLRFSDEDDGSVEIGRIRKALGAIDWDAYRSSGKDRPRKRDEVRTFDDNDLELMRMLSVAKLFNAGVMGTKHTNRVRAKDETITGYITGFKGEFALCDSLGLDRAPNISGVADDGADIEIRGETIDVKSTPYANGKIMVPKSQKKPIKADWIVLVCGSTKDPTVMKIVGGVTVDEWKEGRRLADFGHGDTYYLEQDDLHPWLELRSRWRDGVGAMQL